MLKAAITTILLASSSVAMADTPYPYNQPAQPQGYDDRYYDERYDDRYTDQRGTQMRGRRPVLLANDVFLNARDSRPVWVAINGRPGVTRLRLQLQSGRTFIENIIVVYADNHRETIPVRKMMSVRDPAITIDLTHRGLQGVFIDPAPTRFARGGGWNWRRGQNATIDVIGVRR